MCFENSRKGVEIFLSSLSLFSFSQATKNERKKRVKVRLVLQWRCFEERGKRVQRRTIRLI